MAEIIGSTRRVVWLLLGLLAALTAVAGIQHFNSEPSKADSEIFVGLPVSLSGNWAALGNNVLRGAQLATEEINAKRGVLGRTISLDVQDSDEAASPARLLQTYHYLRSRGRQLFIGPTGTPGGLALAPLAAKENVLLIAPAVGVNKGFVSPRHNLFNIQGGWEGASALIARYAYAHGERRMALFSSEHPFEHTQADAFSEAFRKLGGDISAREEPNPGNQDLRSEATVLVRSKPDAIFLSNYNQLAIASRTLRSLGYTGRFYTVQVDASRQVGASGALDGTVFAQLSKPQAAFAERFRERFHLDPDYPADFAYDAVYLLVQAIERSQSLEPAQLALVLPTLKYSGASGNLRFDDAGQVIREPTLWVVQGARYKQLDYSDSGQTSPKADRLSAAQ